MLRHWMLGAAGGLLLASTLWARPGVVKTRDGQTFAGDVTEQGDEILVEQKGIRATVSRDNLRSLTYSDSIAQDYQRRLSRLTQYDVPGRLELAHWLFENQQMGLAREVLENAARIQPHNAEVVALLRTLDRQEDLAQREARKHAPIQLAAADNDPRAGTQLPAGKSAPAEPAKLLTPEQINTIRQAEWQEGEPIHARFGGDVRRKYIAREGISPAEFNRLTPAQQAWAILQRGTPEMKKDVLLSDPPVMLKFRQVQRSLVASCAACHTPQKPAGGLALYMPADNDAATYTNFLSLQKYTHREGDREYRMIDRERPEESLLLQFALPPEMAKPPHPATGGYKGVVRTRNDPRLKTAADWVSSLNPIAPDYADLLKPAAKPAPQPTTRPAPRPAR